MGRWKRFKRRLRRLVHPNVFDLKAAIRLGEWRQSKKQRMQLPPIFGEKPVYIPMYVSVPPEAYHQRLQERRRLSQHSTAMIRKTILLSAADMPPLEGATLHDIPAWLR